jgi:hypothetical protein
MGWEKFFSTGAGNLHLLSKVRHPGDERDQAVMPGFVCRVGEVEGAEGHEIINCGEKREFC